MDPNFPAMCSAQRLSVYNLAVAMYAKGKPIRNTGRAGMDSPRDINHSSSSFLEAVASSQTLNHQAMEIDTSTAKASQIFSCYTQSLIIGKREQHSPEEAV